MARASIGITTFTEVILEVWRGFDIIGPPPQIECFKMIDQNGVAVRVYASQFETAEEYVDEAWERNR